jgi:hypothetical protein
VTSAGPAGGYSRAIPGLFRRHHQPAPPRVVAELDAAPGLTTGAVALPGRTVHVGVWFRLLRTLLDEVSTAPSRAASAPAALEHVWQGPPVVLWAPV